MRLRKNHSEIELLYDVRRLVRAISASASEQPFVRSRRDQLACDMRRLYRIAKQEGLTLQFNRAVADELAKIWGTHNAPLHQLPSAELRIGPDVGAQRPALHAVGMGVGVL